MFYTIEIWIKNFLELAILIYSMCLQNTSQFNILLNTVYSLITLQDTSTTTCYAEKENWNWNIQHKFYWNFYIWFKKLFFQSFSNYIFENQLKIMEPLPNSPLPSLPTFDFVLNDSPVCHQSLRYWGKKASEVRNLINIFFQTEYYWLAETFYYFLAKCRIFKTIIYIL